MEGEATLVAVVGLVVSPPVVPGPVVVVTGPEVTGSVVRETEVVDESVTMMGAVVLVSVPFCLLRKSCLAISTSFVASDGSLL